MYVIWFKMLSNEVKKIENVVSILTFLINEYKIDFKLKLLVFQRQLELSIFQKYCQTQSVPFSSY